MTRRGMKMVQKSQTRQIGAAKAILVTGCGTDAAPCFKIFNSITQEQKFDPNENYVRRIEPEIAALPDEYLFNPWEAPE